jgi:hypothetical protein
VFFLLLLLLLLLPGERRRARARQGLLRRRREKAAAFRSHGEPGDGSRDERAAHHALDRLEPGEVVVSVAAGDPVHVGEGLRGLDVLDETLEQN